ncbi:hypothetical protein [uncultured Helicobacter sp.]|uniref:hypothetical protein n=1 Tax=uncultured Helicobacter sp. TaxID=175537 RepID=UPI0027DC7855|nr:hypothetical protein [uncultured Helicobacter sp.]
MAIHRIYRISFLDCFMYGFFSRALHSFRMTSDRLCIMDRLASLAMTRNVVIATFYFATLAMTKFSKFFCFCKALE